MSRMDATGKRQSTVKRYNCSRPYFEVCGRQHSGTARVTSAAPD